MKCDTRIKSRRRWRNFGPLVAVLYVLIASASIVHAAESPRRPNIVILFADDMNYAGPSCYGGRWGLETRHIDRLAKEGIRCTNAYVSVPTCGPSRAGPLSFWERGA